MALFGRRILLTTHQFLPQFAVGTEMLIFSVARELLKRGHMVQMDDSERYARDQGYRQVWNCFSDNNALMRRSVWEKQPYPDVDFAEDQIWAQKIIEAGYKKAYARFGYVLCPSSWVLMCSWLALILRDMAFARSSELWRSQPLALIRAPFDNLMRLVGHYLGACGDRLTDGLCRRLSRDKRLMLGLSTPSRETGNI